MWISAEPLIGAIHMSALESFGGGTATGRLVIIGGETGKGYREMDMGSARGLLSDCRRLGIAAWVKQDSGPVPGRRGRWTEEEFAIREMPQTTTRPDDTLAKR